MFFGLRGWGDSWRLRFWTLDTCCQHLFMSVGHTFGLASCTDTNLAQRHAPPIRELRQGFKPFHLYRHCKGVMKPEDLATSKQQSGMPPRNLMKLWQVPGADPRCRSRHELHRRGRSQHSLATTWHESHMSDSLNLGSFLSTLKAP